MGSPALCRVSGTILGGSGGSSAAIAGSMAKPASSPAQGEGDHSKQGHFSWNFGGDWWDMFADLLEVESGVSLEAIYLDWQCLLPLLGWESKPSSRKSGVPCQDEHSQMKEILAALQKGPFNQRLALHLKRILGGDPPVTRSEVLELDPKCVVLFDWVTNLVAPLLGGSQAPEILEVPELPEQRESASVAVGEQEKKVAQLRRKLRETIRSQQAAAEFAAQNKPGNVEMDTQCVDPVRNGHSNGQGRQGGAEENEVLGKKVSKRELLELEVTGQKSLQYRLEEVTIPSTQEAILQSLVKILMEPRGMHRHLEVVGHCEDSSCPKMFDLISSQSFMRPGYGVFPACAKHHMLVFYFAVAVCAVQNHTQVFWIFWS